MKCPNCGVKMKENWQREFCQTDIDEAEWYISDYCCKNCDIHYDPFKCEYILPYNLMPTEKQRKTVLFICNRLIINEPRPITKSQHCEFIGKYFEKAKNTEIDYFGEEDMCYEYFEPQF